MTSERSTYEYGSNLVNGGTGGSFALQTISNFNFTNAFGLTQAGTGNLVHLEENTAAATLRLTPEDLATLAG